MSYSSEPMTQRFIPNESSISTETVDAEAELRTCLTSLIQGYPPSKIGKHDFSGLYYGPTSIAYLFLHLSKSHPDLLIEKMTPRSWCQEYLNVQRKVYKTDPNHCGVANEELAYYAVAAAESQDLGYAKKLLKFVDTIVGGSEVGSDEWLYGRAGYLYLLRLVRSWVPAAVEQTKIDEAIEKVIQVILLHGPHWKWHGKEYLGAVHGTIGIITQVVLSSPKYAPTLEPELAHLLDLQDSHGNWPSSAGKSGSNELVQFCHGAPGFLLSLNALSTAFQYSKSVSNRIERAVELGQKCVWKYGVLTKEPCLCHGTSGNALVFKAGSKEYHHFLQLAAENTINAARRKGLIEESKHPFGLYTGLAGRAWPYFTGSEGLIGYSDV